MIERKILIGLITSTEFLKEIRPHFDPQFIESSTARLLSTWTIDYFDEYKKCPNTDIEDIFYKKLNEGLDKESAEEIENDILPDLSDEYTDEPQDIKFLIDETFTYFQKRKLLLIAEQIEGTIEQGKGPVKKRVREVLKLVEGFKRIEKEKDDTVDLSKPESEKDIREAFEAIKEPIVRFPKQLGKFWNQQFIPGGFLAFLAPEKRGKTWILIMIINFALKQGRKVALFQAGDMNKSELIKREVTYLTKRNTDEKYCKAHFEAVRDCYKNQWNTCQRKERESDFGCMEDVTEDEYRDMKMQDYEILWNDMQDYKPCYNCEEFDKFKLGVPWVKPIESCEVLDVESAIKARKNFFKKYKGQFKIATYPSSTLTVEMAETQLDKWEEKDDFVAEIILFDYLDIMTTNVKEEFRHRENTKWKEVRALSQKPRRGILPLVISPTQADTKAFKKDRLQLENFSEDKRKYGHVTGFWGLNQDKKGIEKSMGLLAINELILREGDFSEGNEITLIQNLKQGRPLKGSYFSTFKK